MLHHNWNLFRWLTLQLNLFQYGSLQNHVFFAIASVLLRWYWDLLPPYLSQRIRRSIDLTLAKCPSSKYIFKIILSLCKVFIWAEYFNTYEHYFYIEQVKAFYYRFPRVKKDSVSGWGCWSICRGKFYLQPKKDNSSCLENIINCIVQQALIHYQALCSILLSSNSKMFPSSRLSSIHFLDRHPISKVSFNLLRRIQLHLWITSTLQYVPKTLVNTEHTMSGTKLMLLFIGASCISYKHIYFF